MTAATVTNIKRHISGDQIKVVATVVANNAYTWDVPHMTNIEDLTLVCSTAAAHGATISGKRVTFVTGSSLTFIATVYGR